MESLLKIVHVIPATEYGWCIVLFLSMLVGALMEAVGIGTILPLISAMGNTNFLNEHEKIADIMEWFGISEHSSFIIFCAAGLMLFYFLKNSFLCFSIYNQVRFVIRNQAFFSKQLLAEYLDKPYVFHLRHNTAKLLRNVNDGALTVFTLILLPLFGLITECITSMAIWVMLMIVDPFTATVVAGFLGGLILFIAKTFRNYIGRQGEAQNTFRGQYLAWANQGLGAIKETKTMHSEDYFLTRFDCAYQQYGKASGKFDFLNQMPKLLIEVVMVSGLLFLIMVKIAMGFKPMNIVPLLGLLALAAFRLMPSANRIVSYYNAIKFQLPFFHEIYPEMRNIQQRSLSKKSNWLNGKSERLPFDSEIYVEHVTFSYNDGQEVLRDISFRIGKGDFVGIVGASGAGKTTFVDVLLGLLPPSQGKIMIDGVDISTNVRGWQENLAYVPQTIYLIDASIKENIALGQDVENIDGVEMERVLRMAELYDCVQKMPEGIETVVGERGVRLSGGQRQRIGIARALYRKPRVLILDEATSALDNETEKSITDTILRLKGQMTIISIAHRVSTLLQCDYKVKFQDGCCELVP